MTVLPQRLSENGLSNYFRKWNSALLANACRVITVLERLKREALLDKSTKKKVKAAHKSFPFTALLEEVSYLQSVSHNPNTKM